MSEELTAALEPILQAIAKSGKVEALDRHNILSALRASTDAGAEPVARVVNVHGAKEVALLTNLPEGTPLYAHPPADAVEYAQAIAIGRKLDAEDGGYPTRSTPDTIRSHYGNGGRFDPGSELREALLAKADEMRRHAEASFYPKACSEYRAKENAFREAAALSTLTRTDEASTDGEGV